MPPELYAVLTQAAWVKVVTKQCQYEAPGIFGHVLWAIDLHSEQAAILGLYWVSQKPATEIRDGLE